MRVCGVWRCVKCDGVWGVGGCAHVPVALVPQCLLFYFLRELLFLKSYIVTGCQGYQWDGCHWVAAVRVCNVWSWRIGWRIWHTSEWVDDIYKGVWDVRVCESEGVWTFSNEEREGSPSKLVSPQLTMESFCRPVYSSFKPLILDDWTLSKYNSDTCAQNRYNLNSCQIIDKNNCVSRYNF